MDSLVIRVKLMNRKNDIGSPPLILGRRLKAI